jgi:hypothetical protein
VWRCLEDGERFTPYPRKKRRTKAGLAFASELLLWLPRRASSLSNVAAIACLGLLAEGEMEHWSGIYLRDTLGLAAIVGGSGVAVFYGAQALGRLASGWIVGRVGNRRTLLGSGLLAAGGILLALATTSPALVIGGFLLVGLALAAVAPLAFSVAGDLVPERAGSAVSVVTTFGYGGFLLGLQAVAVLRPGEGVRDPHGVGPGAHAPRVRGGRLDPGLSGCTSFYTSCPMTSSSCLSCTFGGIVANNRSRNRHSRGFSSWPTLPTRRDRRTTIATRS